MQAAVPVGQGAMAALLGVGLDVGRKVAAEARRAGRRCLRRRQRQRADPGRAVSGHKTAIDRVAEVGKAHGVRRALPLPVSAPFHCSLMKPAADAMAEAWPRSTSRRRPCRSSPTCWPRRSAIPTRSASAWSSR